MFRNVFLKTLYDMRGALLTWCVVMFSLSMIYMLFYPSMQENTASFERIYDSLPPAVRAVAGDVTDFNSIKGFISMKALSMYPIMMLIFAASYGAGFIGSEEESGTLDLLLATPVARWRVVVEKYAALVVFSVVVLIVTYLGFLGGELLVDVGEMDAGPLLAGVMNMAPLTLFFAALALCLNGLKRGRSLALGITIGAASTTYLIYTMAELADIPLWLQRLSPWYYYDGNRVMYDGLNPGYIGLLLGVAALFVALAMWGFERRDVGA